MSGDAVDTGSREAYEYLKEITDKLNMPIYFIPGNHDNRDEMREAFKDKDYMPKDGYIQYSIDNLPVRLIGLDTNVKNADHGELDEERLDWLEQQLVAEQNKPTLIFMHHFPFKVGQPIFDTIICNASPRFEAMIKTAPNVLGIVAGHFYNQVSATFAGKPFLIGKSVAPSHEFSADGMKVIAFKLEDPAFTVHTYDDAYNILISKTEFVLDRYISWEECHPPVIETSVGWDG